MESLRVILWQCFLFAGGLGVATAYWMFAMRSPYKKCPECKGRIGKGSVRRDPRAGLSLANDGCSKCGGKRLKARWSTRFLPKELR
jgi:hypothetical protein